MNMARRQFILLSTCAPLMIMPGVSVSQEMDWRNVCRSWMYVLLPDDERGHGANVKDVWMRIEQIMSQGGMLSSWLKNGLEMLAEISIPNDSEQIEVMLSDRSNVSEFLRGFQEILIESYYTSVTGWQDIGFESPALPGGFPLK